MNVVGVEDKDRTYVNRKFIGGPLDGKIFVTKGKKFPERVRCSLTAIVEYFDDDRGGLCSEWRGAGGESLGTFGYVWSPSSCAYVPESSKERS